MEATSTGDGDMYLRGRRYLASYLNCPPVYGLGAYSGLDYWNGGLLDWEFFYAVVPLVKLHIHGSLLPYLNTCMCSS